MKNFYKMLTACVLFLQFADDNTFGQITGQVPINPKKIPQFVDPLPHFAGKRVDASGGSLTIRHVPTEQVAVSTGTILANGTAGVTPGAGLGRYWTYSVSNNGIDFTPANWPAFSIVARQGTPVNVTYENLLNGETYESVNLIADQTLHWAAPGGMDMMNMFPYIGPIPVVPHLHGGEVPSESDGGPDAWFTPGLADTGPSWGKGGTDDSYFYPNTQEAATLWWHDHALGATRLNVYAGLAGFYFLKGQDEELARLPGWSGDDLVREIAPPGKSGVFNPDPYLPEIEVVFQDRMFDTFGKLYFPNLPTNPMVHPFWTPEFLGDVITVNGKTWPYLSVAPRKYRFRLLNGSNARFYEIQLRDLVTGAIGPQIIQVGTDGGLMDTPIPIVGKLLLAPGERADVVIDFTASAPGQVWTLTNSARAPYPKGGPPNGATTGRIMQFVVNGEMVSASDPSQPGTDKSSRTLPLRTTPIVRLSNFAGGTNVTPTVKRQLTLNEVMGMGGPLEVLVNNTKWEDPNLGLTEQPVAGTTELWQIINLTADAHPMHLHLVQFQIVSRQPFNVNNYTKAYNTAFGGAYVPSIGPPKPYDVPNTDAALGGNPAITPFLLRGLRPPLPNERGWKDTHVVMPGEVTTFIVRFAPTSAPANATGTELEFPFDPSEGPGYVWHCHIVDHEDNEMMRPYKVLPPSAQPGLAGLRETSFGSKNLKTSSSNVVPEQVGVKQDEIILEQNYPNPFSNSTEIRFSLPEPAHVRIMLLNAAGIPINTILDADAPDGLNTIVLDAANLKTGIYYYQLKTGNFSKTMRMVVQN